MPFDAASLLAIAQGRHRPPLDGAAERPVAFAPRCRQPGIGWRAAMMRSAKKKRADKISRENRSLAGEAQRQWVNHMFATRPDELLLQPGVERPDVVGKGKWKCWTAVASQRVAFADAVCAGCC